MRRTLLLSCLAVLTPSPARSHGRTGLQRGYVSTVSALDPNILGVDARVLGGDDRLWLANYSGKTIVILGYEHEPYLRFGEDGVYANIHAPDVQLNRSRFPGGLNPGSSDPTAPPSWERVADGTSYAWHDHRIHWASSRPPEPVRKHPDQVHLVFNWRVPARADGRPFAITGFLGYVPPRGARSSDETDWLLPAVAASTGAAALVAVGLGVRRRRRRTPN
jgi:hypothetical protein